MVEKLANVIVEQMEEEKFSSSDMREYYVYGFVTFVEKWITIGSIVCISAICKELIPTLLFLIFFLTLRKRTGGYHAKEFWQCYIGTVATYIGVILAYPILVANKSIMYGLLVCAVILIGLIGTINHPNMAFNSDELRESKKAARYVLVLECMVLIAFVALDISMICIGYMSMAIILCAFLMCLAKILGQE